MIKNIIIRFALTACSTILLLASMSSHAELSSIDDEALSVISGQAGVYLSGEIAINENGGPIQNAYFGDCTDSKRCGARLAVQTKENGGWFVLDNFKGAFSFQGLTLRVRDINSGFGGDGAKFNREVLEIGLPDQIKVDKLQYTYATSSTARPTDLGFKQTDIYTVEIDGNVTLQGNLLVFPTGNN
ncbi:DUF6160 family protein [Alkalimarinus alittae]|uniref:DUF6160 domain-containing protein n=1 Tax=Alkalimarinus alittae TaxID=2961619 RepID=A0ABY6N1E3_9ALTE|nr:DUF6160 family protein [Alkalimarinus alittae]UZE95850.1 hypothetical protein NKI27_17625 [Alkalimarinus alittae]